MDLIDRQATIDALVIREQIIATDTPLFAALVLAENVIKALPSAQPERKKGKWIESGAIACSVCHIIWLYRRTNYCPNCGAMMEVEDAGTKDDGNV